MTYPWYSRVADVAHRVTVLALAGGTVYMLGGAVYTIAYRSRYNKEKLDQYVAENSKGGKDAGTE